MYNSLLLRQVLESICGYNENIEKIRRTIMKVIEIKDLVKKYDDLIAVDNINLSIEKGEIYGLLGPNGAGKSTLISIISSLLKQTSGTVKVFGIDTRKNRTDIKRKIGIVPQTIAVYKNFTAYENVKFFGELYGLRKDKLNEAIDKALGFVGLEDVRNKKAEEFSGGMLRRLNIACALLHRPEIIIMDEPTVGIDPQSRNHILNAVKKLNSEGATVIYTTHYMEEVESICTKIAIIDKGKVIVEGTKDELKDMINDKRVLNVKVNDTEKINLQNIEKIKGVDRLKIKDNDITIQTVKEVNNLDQIIKSINDSNVKILDLGFKEITLENVFLSLTGRNLRD